MQEIKLETLKLKNFKGLQYFVAEFDKETWIVGDNRKGKTTNMNALLWLLFGKDADDRDNFEIKPYKEDGTTVAGVESEVEGKIRTSEGPVKLKRVFKEKWQKPKGAEKAVMTGHTTEFYIDDVPKSMKEYNEFVEALCPLRLFKLITNPLYFSSLPWTDQRKLVFEIAGGVTDEEVAQGNPKHQALLDMLTHNKTLEDLKKQIASERLKIKKRIDEIPVRIDEAAKSRPEIMDWKSLEEEIKELTLKIQELENEGTRESNVIKEIGTRNAERQQKINDLKSEKAKFIYAKQTEHEEAERKRCFVDPNLKSKLDFLKSELTSKKERSKELAESIETLKGKRDKVREDYYKASGEELEIDEKDFCCPTCKRAFDVSDIEEKRTEMLSNFNKNKAEKIDSLKKSGFALKEKQENFEKELTEIEPLIKELEENSIPMLKETIGEVKTPIPFNPETLKPDMESFDRKISDIEASMETYTPTKANNMEERAKLQAQMAEKAKSLNTRDELVKIDARIKELKEEQQLLADEMAEKEGILFQIEKFDFDKVALMEENVNSKFKIVRFRLFNELIKRDEVGNKVLDPTCIATVHGVPFHTLNTELKVNAGLDIINALTLHYNVKAPVFIDNRESITTLIENDLQVINLFKVKNSKLKIVENEPTTIE